jgi:hypothetical protein
MTKELGNSSVGVATMTRSPPFEDLLSDHENAGMSEFPITANDSGARFWTADGNGGQRHVDTVFLENPRLGAEPSDALPGCPQPRRGANRSGQQFICFRPSEERWGHEGTSNQTQDTPPRNQRRRFWGSSICGNCHWRLHYPARMQE